MSLDLLNVLLEYFTCMMIGEGEDNTNHYVFHSLLYALIESAKHEQIEAEETVDFRLRQDTEKYPK